MPRSVGAPQKHEQSKTQVPNAVDGERGAASGTGFSLRSN